MEYLLKISRLIDYRSNKTKGWTFVLLILQVYPQYKIIDFVRHKNPNHKEWQKKMAEWESGIGLLEPYLESILQVNVQLCSLSNHVFIS